MNLELAQAEIGLKDYARANHVLEQELPGAQRAGVRFGLARIYYLLGMSARLSGSAGIAAGYYREAAQLLDVIRSDPVRKISCAAPISRLCMTNPTAGKNKTGFPSFAVFCEG